MHHTLIRCTLVAAAAAATLTAQKYQFSPTPPFWAGYGRDPAHTAQVTTGSQPLNQIRWSTPVDLQPQYTGTNLLIHYGTPLFTAGGFVLVTVKTGASGGFQIECRAPANGALRWTQTTDYLLPPHNWTPSCGSTLTPRNQLATPAAGGTILLRADADSPTSAVARLAFYGLVTYQANQAAFDAGVQITTPITADANGNLFFGFRASGTLPISLQSGIARIDRNGVGSWVDAATASGDPSIQKVVYNCAPAITGNGASLYVTVNSSNTSGGSGGYLLKLDATTLAMQARVRLKDVAVPGNDAYLYDDGTASPTIGPDGEVYIGVLENPFGINHLRGWLRHFDANLTTSLLPGPFGWDDTAAIVPRSMLPQYTGTSSYFVLTKYNNYWQGGGDGLNRLGVFDPHASMVDPITGATVMNKVIDVLGPTPDPTFPSGVREWCINTAAIDVRGQSAIVNCEDGRVYRWHLPTNTLLQGLTLTTGIGEAYTPTIIGMDGLCFAINNATLYVVGQ
jgi:outer membrane protein assembly factor BamB